MKKLKKELNALIIALVLLLSYPLVAQTTFNTAPGSVGLNIGGVAGGSKDGGHAWADYDNDGDLDVLVLVNSTSQRNYLMRNNRINSPGPSSNTFTNVQPSLASGMLAGVPAERSAAWGDINNDGQPDFMMNSHGNSSATTALQIFIQNVDGTFGDGIGGSTPITVGENASATITIADLNTEGLGFFDFEGDGDLDIYFDSHNYGIELLRNNYIDHITHTIVNPAPASLYTHITTGNGSPNVDFGLNQYAIDGDYGTAADVNDDGWVDLFMRKRGENDFFLNQGGTFTNGANLAEAENNNKGGNGLWDLDNDGDLDAVWTENGTTQIFRNDGPGVWTALGSAVFPFLPQPANTSNTTSSAGIDALAGGDIDNDGDIDIILVGNSRSYLYINQLNSPTPAPGQVASGTAMTFTLDPETFNNQDGEGTTMVDVDDDGDLDIYMNINHNSGNRLFINNLPAANRNNHLIVNVTEDRNPDGTTGGFPGRIAIGTNVLIKDCDGNIVSGLRQVNGSFGHGTQQSPLVHFGLPLGEGQTYLIEVHYPNLYNAAAGSITRLIATGIAQPSTIVGTNHYILTTTDAESLQNPNAPVADDDAEDVTTAYNISVQISLFDNDSEPDGDNFFIESIVQPAIGSVVIDDADTGLVTFTYTAGTAFTGTTFDYTISDADVTLCPSAGLTDTATVTINPPTPEDCTNGIDDDGDGLVDCDDPDCNLRGNGYDWYFGQNAGLDFENAGGPIQVPSPLMNAEEGCSVRSDEQGNLLFYTDGTTVYNRNHQIMPNGGGLSGGPSATQSGVIVKDPGNVNRYYVFYINNTGSQSYYATIDMTLNGGLGDVVTKNTLIQAVGGEKIAAWPHANGTDIWVILVDQNNIYARLLTSGGIGAAVTTNIASPGRRYGQMKFAPDGSKLAIACYPNSFSGYQVQLVDFNNSTGQFSNLQSWALDEPYGVEFSPDGNFLYITDMGWASAPGRIMQYDILNNTTGATIGASGISILSASHLFSSLQIAPDEKIYMATSIVGNNPRNGLAVINSPNSAGLAANAVDDQITFTGGVMSRSGLPNIPAYQLRSTPVITPTDISQTCFSNIELQVNAFGATSYQWLLNGVPIAGETNPTINPDTPGDYQVEVTYGCDTETTDVYILNADTDDDCVDDIVDIDDDNDGILDTVESGGINPDTDADGDGVPLFLDDDDSLPGIGNDNGLIEAGFDADADGIANHLDLDADNDGIPDNVEAQTTLLYTPPNADSEATYATNNGLNSAYLSGGITPTNTDGADNPDYLDLDSDNEGANDTVEAGITLANNDADGDGLDDNTDATADYSDPGGTIDNPLAGGVILPDADADATTGGDVDFRDLANPFTCDESLYLTQYPDATPATLYDLGTNTNPFTVANIGDNSHGIIYNAIGFNPIDNFMYGVELASNTLVRIDADGTAIRVGAVTGLPSANYLSGEIDENGNLYVLSFGPQNTMYVINISILTATSVVLSNAVDTYDISYNITNGLLYGVNRTGAAATVGALFTINPLTGVVSAIGGASTLTDYGAMYASSTGEIYGNLNAGGFYQFNTTTGVRTIISSSPSAEGNDGAHCVTAPITFDADLGITKTDGTTSYTPGTTTTYTIVASNNGPFGVVNAIVADAVPTGIPAANVSYSAVASSGSSTSIIGTQTGAINDQVSLAVNGTATYTVTITIPITFTGNLVNTATISNPPNSSDPDPSNNTATDTNTLGSADLSLTKAVNNSNPDQGDNITFTITVINDGPSPTTIIEVEDIIPTDFTYTHPNFVTSQGVVTFNAGSRALNWNLGAYVLTSGSSIALTYTVTVDVCGEFVNQVEILNSSVLDPDSTPNNGQ